MRNNLIKSYSTLNHISNNFGTPHLKGILTIELFIYKIILFLIRGRISYGFSTGICDDQKKKKGLLRHPQEFFKVSIQEIVTKLGLNSLSSEQIFVHICLAKCSQ